MDWAYFSTRRKWTYVGIEHQLIQNDYRLNCKNTKPGHFFANYSEVLGNQTCHKVLF